MPRACVIVLDAVGAGALPDAGDYGDEGSDTLGNVARAVGGLDLPNLEALGLGNVEELEGCPPQPGAPAVAGRLVERSKGKDTTTGHWELMGIVTPVAMPTYPHGFPSSIIEEFAHRTGRGVLGNKAASGTEIIQELGEEHQKTGKWVVYTSADSVFQIAAHEETVPLETLYAWSRAARRLLDPYRVARVIARPFVGTPGRYRRTYHRKDFSIATPGPTVLEKLVEAGVPVVGVGKIPDIFDRKGITDEIHTEGNADGLARTEALLDRFDHGLVFVNLVDFDMLYGHRNDPQGYARALEELDRALPRLLGKLRPGEVAAITADHGCDPTTPSTDHSREYVPLLVHAPGRGGGDLGTRASFADLGASVADFFGLRAEVGASFLGSLR
jgi:phosphopentomutase